MGWRRIVDGAADGVSNMSVDEALLESATTPGAGLTLRFYRFTTPTITFGYAQRHETAVDVARCRERRVDVVRRITGGRALLHHHELTFSVTAPPIDRPLKAQYRFVMRAFGDALRALDVPVDSSDTVPEPDSATPGNWSCLAVPTGHELTVGGKKLVAGAMRVRRTGFLLHGSILLSIDRSLWRELGLVRDNGSLLALGLDEAAPRDIDAGALVEAVSSSFETALGAPPADGNLSTEERSRADALEAKYRSETWTKRREAPDSRLVDNSEAVW